MQLFDLDLTTAYSSAVCLLPLLDVNQPFPSFLLPLGPLEVVSNLIV